MKQGICILGDSIAKGVLFDDQRRRYAIAKENPAGQLARALGCSVTNLSKFGSTVGEGRLRFEREADGLQSCDVVLMNFGGNDCDFLWQEISDHPELSHESKTPMAEFEKTYLALIGDIRDRGLTPVLLNLPPVDPAGYFSWISRGLNGANILQWLGGTSDFIYRWHERYSIETQKIAQAADTRLIDLRSVFLERRDYRDFLSADGIHPNERGYALIGQTLLRQL